jgi:hypothetical protein
MRRARMRRARRDMAATACRLKSAPCQDQAGSGGKSAFFLDSPPGLTFAGLPWEHSVMEPVIPLEEHRNQVFADLESPDQGSIREAVAAMRIADLYLAFVARRLWPDFVKRAVESEKPAQPAI